MIPRDELLEEFLLEGRDLIRRASRNLETLVLDPGGREALDSLFRDMHTLKGSAALFALPELTGMLHATETQLEDARRGAWLGPGAARTVERALDICDAWLDALDLGNEPSQHLKAETRALEQPVELSPELNDEAPADDWARDLAASATSVGQLVAIRYTPSPDAYFRGDDPLAIIRSVPGVQRVEVTAPPATSLYDPFHCTLTIRALAAAPIAAVRTATRLVADQIELAEVQSSAPELRPTPGPTHRSLRIDAERLDDLAALMDELVIAKNSLLHETALLTARLGESGRSRDLANSQAALDRIVSGLHGAVTRLRLVALGQLFNRFPRQVREISNALGKDVELRISGELVAVDKSVVERLFEPLLHLVRNAIDHGVETPDARRTIGKPSRATLTIAAQARGDKITIEVSDDGRGIDVGQVRARAVERGLVDAREATELSDSTAANLIFETGFSTASQVNEVSGRGVGMDAVRSAMTQIGGHAALDNQPGQGLTVRLTLPSHVVLTKILVVKAGGDRFGVPLETVEETHRVRREDVTAIRAGRAYVRRENVIPLLRLSDLLGVSASADSSAFPVLMVQAAGEDVGIQIDEIAERVEAPLRPMGGLLSAYPGVLGTVLQGDGEVLLVLDLAELAA